MTSRTAQRVAEAILNDAQSGSAVWDELNGPSAEATKWPDQDGKFCLAIPAGYDDQGSPTNNRILITVQEVDFP